MGLDGTNTVSTTSPDDVSLFQRILWLLNTFYHQILALLTVVILWILFENFNISELFFWHVLLSTIAYVPLMADAIIVFLEDNLVTLYIRRTKRYWIHGILLTISLAAVSVGIIVEFRDKDNFQSNDHFKSNHAILGLVSWILVFLAVVIGLVAANARKFSAFVKPVIGKFVHNFLGIAGFVIGMGSLYLELKNLNRYSSDHVSIATIWALWFITVWSLLAAFESLWSQLRSIFS